MAKYQLFGPGKAEKQEKKRSYIGSTVSNKRSIFRIFFCKVLHYMKKILKHVTLQSLNARCELYGLHRLTLNFQFSNKFFIYVCH